MRDNDVLWHTVAVACQCVLEADLLFFGIAQKLSLLELITPLASQSATHRAMANALLVAAIATDDDRLRSSVLHRRCN